MTPKLMAVTNADGTPYGVSWDCPGCEERHVVPTHGPNAWAFNGDFVDRPTLSPSILVYPAQRLGDDGGPRTTPRCHCFIRDGRIDFCSDSEHRFAGQTVELQSRRDQS